MKHSLNFCLQPLHSRSISSSGFGCSALPSTTLVISSIGAACCSQRRNEQTLSAPTSNCSVSSMMKTFPVRPQWPSRIHLLRNSSLTHPMPFLGQRALNKFAQRSLRADGVFILYLISKNAGDIITTDIIATLWGKFLEDEAQVRP
ncbi:unnamed protein product [Strongylus vulgaris]|uniref:Innexin n=1 Tax=Strongylus vulgaris TaxID=40348 RepID=A0A3P7JH75_STRVU|nr:unnamed protein product [Strongylus vulgaris]